MTSESRTHYDRIAREAILFCNSLREREPEALTPAEARLLKVVDEYQEFVEEPVGVVRSNWVHRVPAGRR